MFGGADSLEILVLRRLLFAFLLSNIICALTDPLRRGLHDVFVKTLVVKSTIDINKIIVDLEQLRSSRPKWSVVQWGILGAPFIILAATGIGQFKTPSEEDKRDFAENRRKTFDIIGTDEFVIQNFAAYPTRDDSLAAPAAFGQGAKFDPDEAPFDFVMAFDFTTWRKMPEKARTALEGLPERMDDLRAVWLLGLDPKVADYFKESGLSKARMAWVKVSFFEELDFGTPFTRPKLGYAFRDKPVFECRSEFSPIEMRMLGFDAFATPTLTLRIKPATAPTTNTLSGEQREAADK